MTLLRLQNESRRMISNNNPCNKRLVHFMSYGRKSIFKLSIASHKVWKDIKYQQVSIASSSSRPSLEPLSTTLTKRLSSSTTSSSSPPSSWEWEDSAAATAAQGLFNLLTNQQRALLQEQKQVSQSALELAYKINRSSSSTTTTTTGASRNSIIDHTHQTSFLQHILASNNDTQSTSQLQNDNNNEDDKNSRQDSKDILDSTFSIVIAGEFNAGKSTLINALLGQKLLETGALPTTDTITVLTSAASESSSSESSSKATTTTTSHSNAITLHRIPNIPLLQDLTFIDTPGTNAIITNHTTRTLKLLPSADLILFVTSADRPFPESERKLLQSIQSYRKNIVIVINKMDVLEASGGNHGDIEKKKVYDFVADNAADLLGARAVILTVSARDALSAKLIHGNGNNQKGDDGSNDDKSKIESSKLWKRSEFAKLESFLMDNLTEEAKIQAKLLNPLGVTDGLLSECINVLDQRRKELETDVATMNLLSNQMNAWKRDMDRDITQFQVDIKDHMQKEMDRCRALIDSIGFMEKYNLLLNDHDGTKLQSKWDGTKSIIVSNDIEKEIIDTVRESTDAIATSARAQGQAVIEYLGNRPAVVGQNLIGSVTAASRFEETRKDLFEKISYGVKSVLSNYDAEKEKNDVFQSLKNSVYLTSALNILSLASGVGIGLEVVDILPGSIGVASFAGLGVGLESYRNNQIRQTYESTWNDRINKLNTALETLCSKEVQRIHKKIFDGVAPYSRYVTTEREDVDSFSEECNNLLASSQSLRNRISKLR